MTTVVKFPPPSKLSPAERKAVADAVEGWIAVLLAQSDHGQVSITVDLKDGKVQAMRGGCEISTRFPLTGGGT